MYFIFPLSKLAWRGVRGEVKFKMGRGAFKAEGEVAF